MARRIQIGTEGWIEVNQSVVNAAVELGGEADLTVADAVAALVSGDADPAQYGLVEEYDEESDGE